MGYLHAIVSAVLIVVITYYLSSIMFDGGMSGPEPVSYIRQEGNDGLNMDIDSVSRSLKIKHTVNSYQCAWIDRARKSPRTMCNFSTIHTYMKECDYFPNQLKINKLNVPYFEHCDLPNPSTEEILNYLHKSVDRVFAFGDSQGNLYAGGILWKLKHLGIECIVTRQEPMGFQSKKDFFFNDTDALLAMTDAYRTCRSCTSFVRICTIPPTAQFTQNKTLHFEFLGLIMNKIDGSMSNDTYCEQHPGIQECELKTLSDVIFKHHLQGTSADLLIMIPTFAHDVRIPFVEFIPKLKALMRLIHGALRPGSQVVWLPSTTANYRTFEDITHFLNDDGTGVSKRIEVLNHWLFEFLLEYSGIVGGPTFHGFFDVGQIGRIKEEEWAADYIHYHHIFYQTVIAMLFNLLPTI